MRITRRLEFDAGHRIPDHASQCRHLHGHRYALEVTLSGDIIKADGVPVNGMVMDFADVKRAFQPLFDQLDHHYLNDVPGLENPTSERLAEWIYQSLKPRLPLLSMVVVHETCTAGSRYCAPDAG